MISRCYLEITNICNLDCLFCPKTDRAKRIMTIDEFHLLTNRLQGEIKFLYFHLMGEPTLHPHLARFVAEARRKGFVPVLTTNGTLLHSADNLIDAGLHKVQISLHSHEGNGCSHLEEYMAKVMQFSLRIAAKGTIVVLRLWNQGGFDSTNRQVLQLVANYAPQPWTERHDGWKVAQNIYIEHDSMFQWPDTEGEECCHHDGGVFCYALRNQVGVLVDGSVVPCCLDHAGSVVLGNLFEQPLAEIIASPRAQAIYQGFTRHTAVEPLCRRCGYAALTKQFRR